MKSFFNIDKFSFKVTVLRNEQEQFCSNYIQSCHTSFTVMVPVGQKILELCQDKSSKPFGSKMRQLYLEINHSCSSTPASPHHFRLKKFLRVDENIEKILQIEKNRGNNPTIKPQHFVSASVSSLLFMLYVRVVRAIQTECVIKITLLRLKLKCQLLAIRRSIHSARFINK